MDETEDLGEKKGSKYFIITAVWVDKYSEFDRLIKNMRRHKFKKQLKKVNELKANKSKPDVRIHLLKKINDIGSARAHSVILDKSKLYSKYLTNNRHKLYNYVCGVLASSMELDSKKIMIHIDRSKCKKSLRDDFDKYINDKFIQNRWNVEVKVQHSWSHAWSGLQIADFVSWAVYQNFEFNDDSYFKLIEDKVNINHVWE